MPRLSILLLVTCPLIAACSEDIASPAEPRPDASQDGARVAECIRLGVQLNTIGMDRCVAATTAAERRLVADRAVYGTS